MICLLPSCLPFGLVQEEVRDILAATGKSGGISAEQILRQFNAKRFAEASKVWAAADGLVGPDPLYFTSPRKTSSGGSYNQATPNTGPPAGDTSSCASGTDSPPCNSEGSGYPRQEGTSSARAYRPRGSGGGADSGGGGGGGGDGKTRPVRVRTCVGGGWVC